MRTRRSLLDLAGKGGYTLAFALLVFWGFMFLMAPSQSCKADTDCAPPPFWSAPTIPNVLMVLDVSGSMQCSAYMPYYFGGYNSNGSASCTPSNSDSDHYPSHAYSVHRSYYGYFDTTKFYRYDPTAFSGNLSDPGGFVEVDPSTCTHLSGQKVCSGDRSISCNSDADCGNSGSCIDAIGGPNCISGNFLNWATMSRIDLLRKALIGGKHIANVSGNLVIRGEGGLWTFRDKNTNCAITLSGGYFPSLAHQLTISDVQPSQGTCGYLTVKAKGRPIWGDRDNFFFVYQRISGNFDIRLRIITPPTETHQTYAKTGLMARANLKRDSRHIMVMATYGDGLQFARRAYDGAGTATFASYVHLPYPIWVRLVRSGQTFTAYYSQDGIHWTQHGSFTFSGSGKMPQSIYVGIPTASYSSSTIGTAELDEFDVEEGQGGHTDDFNDGDFDTSIWSTKDIGNGSGYVIESCAGGCVVGNLTGAKVRLAVPSSQRKGIIQHVLDKNDDGTIDTDAPRIGIEVFSSGWGSANREGCIKVGVTNPTLSELINTVETEAPYGGTPTRYALQEAQDYFQQRNRFHNCNNGSFIGGQGSSLDPWYEEDPNNPGHYISVPCRKSYVITISDGEWNTGGDPIPRAHKSHYQDIRADLSGKQSLDHFALFIFGSESGGIKSMKNLAMYGGFNDLDHNNWPYNVTSYPGDSRTADLPSVCNPQQGSPPDLCREWDKNGDGIPDNYYQASSGEELEEALTQIFEQIQNRGTAGAVATVTQEVVGEDIVVRGAFANDPSQDRIWQGHFEVYWPDTRCVGKETQQECLQAGCTWDDNTGKCLVYGFEENNDEFCCGIQGSSCSSNGTNSTKRCWDGGKALKAHTRIFSIINGTQTDITTTSVCTPSDPLQLGSDDYFSTSDCANFVSWLMGSAWSKARDRKGWIFGDIVYSTPVVVSEPSLASVPRSVAQERCNCQCVTGNNTINEECAKQCFFCYRYKYRHRKKVAYVGANDGMLHAFVVGKWDGTKWVYTPADDSEIGTELWAYVPSNLLSELKCLAKPSYGLEGGCQHRTMVDLSPEAWDVYIDHDNDGTKEWRTVLIGGERGGGDVYFAIDITDPDNPQVLWEYPVIRNMLMVHKTSGSKYKAVFPYLDDNTYQQMKVLPVSWSKPALGRLDLPDGICLLAQPQTFSPSDANPTPASPVCWGDADHPLSGWYALISGGVRVYDTSQVPVSVSCTGLSQSECNNAPCCSWVGGACQAVSQCDPKKEIFKPFFLAIDVEKGINVFQYTWGLVQGVLGDSYWPEVQVGSRYIPYSMAEPAALDLWRTESNGSTPVLGPDGYDDHIFMGDINGLLWGLTLEKTTANGRTPRLVVDLWETKNVGDGGRGFRGPKQPITVTPTAALDANNNLRLYFGTGKFENVTGSTDDKDDPAKMSFYNITLPLTQYSSTSNDSFCTVSGTSSPFTVTCTGNNNGLLFSFGGQSFAVKLNKHLCSSLCTGTPGGSSSDTWTEPPHPDCGRYNPLGGSCSGNCSNCPCSQNCYSCILDLTRERERIVDRALVAGGLVFFTTFIPTTDPCSSGGDAYLYVVDYMCRTLSTNPLEKSGLSYEYLPGGGGTWQRGPAPAGTKVSAYRTQIGQGMPSRPVLDSSGEYIIIQTSNAQIHRIRVELPQNPIYLKGWKEE